MNSVLVVATTVVCTVFAGPIKPGVAHGRRQVTQPWGGAVQQGQGWNFVTGTLTVPEIKNQDPERAVAIWVGIDGYSCQGGAIWQTGLTWYGDGRMENWYEWYPEPPSAYPEPFSASAGDKVKMTVHADSPTSGNSTLENLTTGQSVSIQHSNMQQQLCLQDADWVLEDFEQKELADFGSFTFTDTVANGENGPSNPEGATIVEVEADGQEKTRCRSDANSVTCEYAGN